MHFIALILHSLQFRFSVDFLNKESDDVPLHINPRIPHNYVIRSCRVNKVWTKVEVASSLPFVLHRGHKFLLEILITEECYMISINGHHFAEFKHRLPYKSVNYIEIKGEVENVNMIRQIVATYPYRIEKLKLLRLQTSFVRQTLKEIFVDHNIKTPHIPHAFKTIKPQDTESVSVHGLRLPYYGRLENSLTNGCCLNIEGRVRVLPHSFSINLQQGHCTWPRPNVAFHFSPRYLEKVKNSTYEQFVVCNSFYDRKWSKELYFDIHEDLQPGQTFSLTIMCSKICYEVYINRRWLMDFKYRTNPDIVDVVYIEGDVTLWDVVMDTREWENTHRETLFRPKFSSMILKRLTDHSFK